MILNKVVLKSFMKHKDLSLDFEAGMNILRGANEAGKCISGDTLIHTQDGLVRIDSLDNDYADGWHDIDATVFSGRGSEKVTRFYKESQVPTFKITTKHGYTLRCTENHPLLTYNPETAEHEFKKLSDISEGDFLCIDRKCFVFPEKDLQIEIPDFSSKTNCAPAPVNVSVMTPVLATLCGYLLANGSASRSSYQFSSHNKALLDDFNKAAQFIKVRTTNLNKGDGASEVEGLRISSVNFKRLINRVFGVDRFPTARYKTVPPYILKGTKEVQRVFLRALLDCDGYQGSKGFEWVSASSSVANSVRVMLQGFGIVTTTKQKRVKGYDHDYQRMSITGRELETLYDEILYDSLKYTRPQKFWNSKNDVIPKLVTYIKNITQANSGGYITLASGSKVVNSTFRGKSGGMPQENMQVENLHEVISHLPSGDDRLSRLRSKLEDIAERGYFYSPVASIVESGVEAVYDIEVPTTHEFIANGIVSHNSSLLSGIAYNWYGSGVLPQSVDDTVTWEAKKSSMKTTTMFSVPPYDYVCKRSASGAELYRSDDTKKPLVTGHREVSEAIAELCGIPNVSMAGKLQIASQNDVRGVISLGATAAAAFIEELIDMKEIDDMIADVTSRLVHSSDAQKQTNAGLELAKDRLKEVAPVIDIEELDNAIEEASLAKSEIAPAVNRLQEKTTDLSVTIKTCAGEIAKLTSLRDGQQKALGALRKNLEIPVETVTEEDIAAELALLEQTQAYQFYTDEFLPFKATIPAIVWEGSEESLELFIKGLKEKASAIDEEILQTKLDISATEGSIIHDTVCPTCGQEVCDANEVAAQNQILEKKLVELKEKEDDLKQQRATVKTNISEAEILVAFHHKQEAWVAKRDLVEEVESNTIPKELRLLGGVPDKPVRRVEQGAFNALCAERAKHQKLLETYDETETKCRALEIAIEDFSAEIEKKVQEKDTASEELEPLYVKLAEKREQLTNIDSELANVTAERAAAVSHNERVMKETKSLEAEIASLQKQVVEIGRNRDLVSSLRSARLEVSTLLWQKLLGVTQNYFSIFRGKPSTLNMSKKGILVDDRLSAPSGSTLDILGLALRLAMSKLFANSGLCILDEPSAGCDDLRTSAMTGGLLSAGFDQIIMVTHKDVDESAGNLIII